MRLVIATILFLVAGTWPAAFAAEDHIVARAVFEDAGGTLTIHEVSAQAFQRNFQPAGEILSAGYTPSVHWLKLTVRPRVDRAPLILWIRPTFLDEVTLYEPDALAVGGWASKVTGDRVAFADRHWSETSLGFPIPPSASDVTYYLRLKTTSSSLLGVEALGLQDARAMDFRIDMLMFIYAALMLWILFWAVMEFIQTRSALLGWFIPMQIAYLLYAAAIMGYLAPLFPTAPAPVLDVATSFLVCGVTLVSLVFHRILIVRFAPSAIALSSMDMFILASVSSIMLLALGFFQWGLFINAHLAFLAAPLLIFLAFTAKREALPGLAVLRVIYTMQAVSLVVTIPPILGSVNVIGGALLLGVIQGLISASLIFIFLYLQARQIRKQGVQTVINLQLTEQKLETERDQLDLQSRFLAMLTHELKTPLSVVRVSLDAMKVEGEFPGRIARALKSINDIVERLAQTDRIDQNEIPSWLEPCDIRVEIDALIPADAGNGRIRVTAVTVPLVMCDMKLLGVALGNLIDNALKYSPPDSLVDIRVAPEDRAGRPGVAVTIENLPGPAGFPDPSRVFSKFYRSAGAHSKSGSGLGLYVVRGIVRFMNGEVDYQPASEKVRFVMWLPC